MSLNPDIAAFLELVNSGRAAGKNLAMHQLSPEEARAQFDLSSQMMDAGAADLEQVDSVSIPTRDGQRLAARLYSARPLSPATPSAAVLYFHGGGYVVGSLDSHDALCRALAEIAGCAVVSVAYRLAPQWRFPTAAHDAADAWQWLVEQGAELGIDTRRLALAGDSVGGSLVAVLATQLAAERAAVQPRLQVLIYPVTDASRSTPSLERYASGYLLEKDTLQWFYGLYERDVADRRDPRFSPLLGAVPPGLAPTLMVLGECDPLLDECLAYAAHLREGGALVKVTVYPGMTHDFLRMGAIIDEAEQAQEQIAQALQRVFEA
ncbi:alpha/beta hydrolase [Pseudomonas fluorescens]|uniref:alpha/beta hydrolase n=1 Tax=Pseudomonas fluorescens TaxID=294 RepID=UPI0002F447A9|nr:alpha/beta hydrolase [Pseudomonas fluorescens]